MKKARLAFGFVLGIAAVQPSLLLAQDAPTRTVQVQFAAGTTGSSLSGRITGREYVTYTLGAEAGQRMTIALTSNNTATYFNLYEPGRGPGGEALATGDLTPEINRFDGVLPTSGVYTISVYLFRNAARDGESADYTLDVSINGAAGEVVEGDFADGLQGGPDFWQVATTGNGTLKLRSGPSTGASELARLPRGEVVRNLGCRMNEARRWCQVVTLADPGIEGWAAGEFLAEAGPPDGVATQLPETVPGGSEDALVPGTGFNATGQIECTPDQDAATGMCDFGVTREGNGNGMLTVYLPNGVTRIIRFEAGTPMSFEPGPQDGGAQMTVTRDGDNSIVMIGPERLVIPDAVIFGG